jgi:DNA segregation ATPase FtsK/SpoIIIE-like protein
MPTPIELDAQERELLRRIVDGLPGMERVSVSALQRRFYLGYARAAISMDQLQAFGVVDRNEDRVSWHILVDLATYRFPFEI